MGTGAGGNAPALQKRIRHLAGIQVPDVQGHDGRPARGGKVAIHPDAGKLPDAPVKPQHQPVLPGVQAFHPLCQQVFQSGVKPRQAMTVQGSGLQAGGIGGRLIPVEGVNAAAAPQQGPDLHPRADTQAAGALGASVAEMERRYKLFAENNVRDIKSYNKLAKQHPDVLEHLPYIAIIIDELADLMMVAGKEVEDYICRIAQKARAAGIHLIVATQRPSVDVITGLIKANIPSRIAFAVSSQIDSRTILDSGGAEKLLGNGDMLFLPVGASKPVRVQGTFVTDEEISAVLNFIKSTSSAQYDEEMIAEMERRAVAEKGGKGSSSDSDDDSGSRDPMFEQAVECVIEAGQASTSLLQRRCKLGYARAARIMDQMEQEKIIGPYEGAKPRAVLLTRAQWQERQLGQGE